MPGHVQLAPRPPRWQPWPGEGREPKQAREWGPDLARRADRSRLAAVAQPPAPGPAHLTVRPPKPTRAPGLPHPAAPRALRPAAQLRVGLRQLLGSLQLALVLEQARAVQPPARARAQEVAAKGMRRLRGLLQRVPGLERRPAKLQSVVRAQVQVVLRPLEAQLLNFVGLGPEGALTRTQPLELEREQLQEAAGRQQLEVPPREQFTVI